MASKEQKETNYELVQVVSAVILNEAGDKVLVGQRSLKQSYPLKWEFIGGKVELGESPEEALKREVAEEINLQVAVGRLLDVVEVDYRQMGRPSHQILFYECRRLTKKATIDPDVYKAVKWVHVNDLPGLDWVEGEIEFAKKLVGGLETLGHKAYGTEGEVYKGPWA